MLLVVGSRYNFEMILLNIILLVRLFLFCLNIKIWNMPFCEHIFTDQ